MTLFQNGRCLPEPPEEGHPAEPDRLHPTDGDLRNGQRRHRCQEPVVQALRCAWRCGQLLRGLRGIMHNEQFVLILACG